MAYDVNKLTKLQHLKALAEKIKELMPPPSAEENLIDKIKVNGVEQTITDKVVDIAVPTKISDLTNDSKFQTESEVATKISTAVAAADHLQRKVVASTADINLSAADADKFIYMVSKTGKDGDKYDEYMIINGVLEKVGNWEVDLSNYVEKDGDKVLSANDFTDALKAKLDGIEEGANKYNHPAFADAVKGLYKITVSGGHVSATEAVGNATTTVDGLMSSADKTKLDSLNIVTDIEVTEMLNEVFA